jgi:hypothetical protein
MICLRVSLLLNIRMCAVCDVCSAVLLNSAAIELCTMRRDVDAIIRDRVGSAWFIHVSCDVVLPSAAHFIWCSQLCWLEALLLGSLQCLVCVLNGHASCSSWLCWREGAMPCD